MNVTNINNSIMLRGTSFIQCEIGAFKIETAKIAMDKPLVIIDVRTDKNAMIN